MKRALGLIFVVIACIAGFLTVRGTLPFMPVFGISMEPVLHAGSLITIQPVAASEVKVGDIIVYNVAPLIREHYNYPSVVAHRVINVHNEDQLTFRTKGDNTGEDPFAVRPGDIRGVVGEQIPYLGWPFLFFQSQLGMIFLVVAISLLALFLYGGELSLGGKRFQRGIFSPVIQETYRTSRTLTHKIEVTEKRMDTTQQALEKFASAVELYAQHLASHTSAIQGLSEASHELKRSSAEQNRVLMHMMQKMGFPEVGGEEKLYIEEKTTPAVEKKVIQPVNVPPVPEAGNAQSPPGCAITRKALLKRKAEVGQNLN